MKRLNYKITPNITKPNKYKNTLGSYNVSSSTLSTFPLEGWGAHDDIGTCINTSRASSPSGTRLIWCSNVGFACKVTEVLKKEDKTIQCDVLESIYQIHTRDEKHLKVRRIFIQHLTSCVKQLRFHTHTHLDWMRSGNYVGFKWLYTSNIEVFIISKGPEPCCHPTMLLNAHYTWIFVGR